MTSNLCKNWILFTKFLIILCIALVVAQDLIGDLPQKDVTISTKVKEDPQLTTEIVQKDDGIINDEIFGVSLNTLVDSCVKVLFPSPDCIPFTVCDGTNPCHYGNCSTDNANNFTCSCFDGYGNNGPGTPCEVINACESKRCQQNCNKTAIGYECSCVAGFILEEDGVSCKFDASSTYVQCSTDCYNGTCLNDTCSCFYGYYRDVKGKCSVIDVCSINASVCGENANCISSGGNYTCECMPNFRNQSGTCQAIDPCDDLSIRQNCESFGKRCRRTTPGHYECYCALPYYPVKDGISDACIPPSNPLHMYVLTLDLIRYVDNDIYTFLRQLEDIFYKELFPSITNVTVLNLEINITRLELKHNLAHLNIDVHFTEEVNSLDNLIQYLCEPFRNEIYSDACILPGMIVVRNSTVNFKVLDDVCNLHDQMSEFLCGSLATCKANSTAYECSCNDGYAVGAHINPMKPVCMDIDECSDKSDACGGPAETCINLIGNYTCKCFPCHIWNAEKTKCVYLCENNPCENNGYCEVNRIQDTCGFQCTCGDEFTGPTCSEINDTIRSSRACLAITGGVLGGLLGVVVIIGIIMIYKVMQRSGYLSFQSTKSKRSI